MAKVDLKDAYFMIPIHEEDRAFLKFSFKEQTYQFQCLPFGLECAPWVFTKTLKPVAALLRQLGVRLIVYIYRRHTDLGRVQGGCSGSCNRPDIFTGEPGLCSKQSHVPTRTNANNRVSLFKTGQLNPTGSSQIRPGLDVKHYMQHGANSKG